MHVRTISIQLAVLALGVGLSGQGCASKASDDGSTADDSAAVTQWPASNGPRQTLGVETWALTGTVGDGELYGLSAPNASGGELVNVHAHITQGADGSFALDITSPKAWHLSFAPGSLPKLSKDVPSEVAYALAQGVLDAPAPAAAPTPAAKGLLAQATPATGSSGGTNDGTSGSLLNGAPICIVKQDIEILRRGATADQTKKVVGKALDTLGQFKACRQNGSSANNPDVPDPTNPAERANYDACVAAVNAAGCDAESAYEAVLDGVATGNAQKDDRSTESATGTSGGTEPTANVGGKTGTNGTGTDTTTTSQTGAKCTYKILVRCPLCPPVSVEECLSASACASHNGTPGEACTMQ